MIKKIRLSNIRSIQNEVEIDLSGRGNIVKIGGRNGSGKSTIIYLGFYMLLGLIKIAPHVNDSSRPSMYEVETDKGIFGVRKTNKDVYYYYKLNTGELDSSSVSVNNNEPLSVIRAYIGFNVDYNLSNILNLNKGKDLNFINTNKRSNLLYFKNLLYAPDIEKVLQCSVEDDLLLKKKINDVSYKIDFIESEISKIKTIDEEKLRHLVKESNNILEMLLNLKKTRNYILNLFSEYNIIQNNRLQYIELKIQLLNKTILLKNLLQNNNIKNNLLFSKKFEIKIKNVINDMKNIYNFTKKSEVIELQKIVLYIKIIKKLEIKKYICNLEMKKLITIKFYCKISNYQLMLENIKQSTITLQLKKLDNTKAIFKGSVSFLSDYRMFLFQNIQLHFSVLKHDFDNIFNVNKNIQKLEEKKSQLSIRDGRCILCNSEIKSNQN